MKEKHSNDAECFIQEKMDAVCKSNAVEFLDTTNKVECARTTTIPFIGITKSTTNNDGGPLSSSISSSSLASPHAPTTTTSSTINISTTTPTITTTLNPLEDRVRAMEKHLGFIIEPIDKDLNQRIKILEEKILRIEHQFPQIATNFFNYGQAEIRASSRPGGRISNLHFTNRTSSGSSSKKIKMEPEDLLNVVEDDGSDNSMQSSSEDDGGSEEFSNAVEIRKRMQEIKKSLSTIK